MLDGIDADGLIDCADDECVGVLYTGSLYCEAEETSCNDDFDNDGDGLTDCADNNCRWDRACYHHTGGPNRGTSSERGNNVSSIIEAVCGNGEIERPEVCDDGNTDDGDICSADCSKIFDKGEGIWEDDDGSLLDTGDESAGTEDIKMSIIAVIRARNIQNILDEEQTLPTVGADPDISYEEFLAREDGDLSQMSPLYDVGPVFPSYLAPTGASINNILYLFLSIFGCLGLYLSLFGWRKK